MSDYRDEVLLQPFAAATLLHACEGGDDTAFAAATALVRRNQPVLLAGMGSSYAAALYGATLLGRRRIFACAGEAADLLYYADGFAEQFRTLVAISQSGASVETLSLAQRAAGSLHLVAVTSWPTSPLARLSEVVLPLHVKEETGTSARTYANSLVTLALLTAFSAQDSALRTAVAEVVTIMGDATAALVEAGAALSEDGAVARWISVIGRGPNLATAIQGALVMKEVARTPAEAHSGGSFLHGPLEACGPDHMAIVIAPPGRTAALMYRLAERLVSFGSRVALIGTEPLAGVSQIRLPSITEEVSPLLAIVPLQGLAWGLARNRVPTPGRLSRTPKVVTEE